MIGQEVTGDGFVVAEEQCVHGPLVPNETAPNDGFTRRVDAPYRPYNGINASASVG